MDLLCCLKVNNLPETEDHESFLHKVMGTIQPLIFNTYVRKLIVIIFLAWFCVSIACIPNITVGLDQRLSMPTDSYVYKSFVVSNYDVQFLLLVRKYCTMKK